MSTQAAESLDKQLHENAKQLARKYIDDFAINLVLQAKMLASQRNDDMVMRNHVMDALEVIQKKKRQNWNKELYILAGGLLVGTFLRGFTSEVIATPINPTSIVIYTSMGIIGLFLIMSKIKE